MSDALVSAVVAGVVSMIVTFGKIAWDSRQKKQDRRVLAREKSKRPESFRSRAACFCQRALLIGRAS